MNQQVGRGVVYLVAIAAIIVILFGVRASAEILNPILLAVVITITALPVPGYLTRRGLPGWLALLLTILMVVLLLGLVIATVFMSVTRLSVELPTYMAEAAVTASQDVPAEVTGSTEPVSTTQLTIQFGPIAQGLIATTMDLLVQFGMALFIFFFMITAAMTLPEAARLGLDPNSSTISRIGTLTGDVRRYMSILTVINFLVGLGDFVFLSILGVDYALLWGLLAWFMGYIPSIGFLIALVPPVLMAYAQYGASTALIVLVGYVLINGGVQNFIQPKMMGEGLRVSPLVIFVCLFVWVFLLGGMGAILAVPLTLLVLTLMEAFPGTRMIAVLLRYTGKEKQEERDEAMTHVKGLWGRTKDILSPPKQPEGAAPGEDAAKAA